MAGPAATSHGRARTRSAARVDRCRPDMEAQEFFQQTEIWSDLRSVTEMANRYNTAIYAVDPRGLAPFEFDLSTQGSANVSLTKDRAMLENTMDTLRILADETDGRAIVNSNDLDKGLRQIVRGLQRVLPARLHLDAVAAGWKISQDQRSSEASGTSVTRQTRVPGA